MTLIIFSAGHSLSSALLRRFGENPAPGQNFDSSYSRWQNGCSDEKLLTNHKKATKAYSDEQN